MLSHFTFAFGWKRRRSAQRITIIMIVIIPLIWQRVLSADAHSSHVSPSLLRKSSPLSLSRAAAASRDDSSNERISKKLPAIVITIIPF